MLESQDGDETKASTIQEESKDLPKESKDLPEDEADDEWSDGPEDKEAFLIKEKFKIDNIVKLSLENFLKAKDSKIAEPALKEKLSVGLAAAVNKKLFE